MKTRSIFGFAAAAVLGLSALGGCVNVVGQVDVTTTHDATFPGVPAALQAYVPSGEVTTDASVTIDVQQELSSVSGVGQVTVTIEKNAISGTDLSNVKHVKATIGASDGTLSAVTLSDVDVPPAATEVEMPVLIGDAQLLGFLKEGSVDLHLYLTGDIPIDAFTLTHTLIAHLNVTVEKSVL